MKEIAQLINMVVDNKNIEEIKQRVKKLCNKYPLYE